MDYEANEQEIQRRAILAKQQKLQDAILVKVCADARLADIVRVFESGDERRRETMWRMATAMPAIKVPD